MLSRRAFLGLTGGAAAVAVGGTAAWRSLVDDRVHDATDPTTTTATPGTSTSIDPDHAGRVLVVVQLGGGNDGLNTLVPAGDGRYYDRRPTLAVPEDQVVALPGLTGYGLNPALGALAPYWAQGRLGLVEGIGFPG
ncbi:MAG: twin-arginine translocation signal domain-containing protein [Acidimicrobiales bacterium]